jgi:flagellar protein FlaJ
VFLRLNILLRILYFIFPIMFVVTFLYFMQMPEYKIRLKEKNIDREIVYACRFLIIELDSGVPLYNAMTNVAKSYKTVGRAFRDIIENIDLGSTIEDAIEDAITLTPSQDFRKVLWQILNSLKTGAEVSSALNAVVDQITREQIIKVSEYGRRLNPIAMFYMMIAVILPSLGITMLIVLSSFLAFELTLTILIVIAMALGFIQFMFIAMIRTSRPAVEM